MFAFCWRTSAVRAFSAFGMKVRSVMFPFSPTESPYAILVASIFRSMYCASRRILMVPRRIVGIWLGICFRLRSLKARGLLRRLVVLHPRRQMLMISRITAAMEISIRSLIAGNWALTSV